MVSRNRKIGGTNTFESEFQLGFDDIRAMEIDADFDTLYNAWNAGLDPSDLSVTTAKLADGSVTEVKLADDAVTRYKIADESITSDKIYPGSIEATHLASNSVSGANIIDGSVSISELDNNTQLRLTPSWTPADASKVLAVKSDGSVLTWVSSPPPGGAAGGDLGGSFPIPTVVQASGSFQVIGQLNARSAIVIKPTTAINPTLALDCQTAMAGLSPAAGAVISQILSFVGGPLAASQILFATEQWTPGTAQGTGWTLNTIQPGTTTLRERLRVDQTGLTVRSPAGASHMTLDSAGAVVLKGSSIIMGNPIQALYAVDPALNNCGIWLNNGYAPQDASKASLAFTQDGNLANGGWFFFYRVPGQPAGLSQVAQISTGGALYLQSAIGQKLSGTTWSNPSDERIKRNVADYTTGLDAIRQLRPVSFEFNGELGTHDTGETCWGFLAREVEQVMPECVGEAEWSQGGVGVSPQESVTIKTLDQSNIILALVNAVKEIAERLDTLPPGLPTTKPVEPV